MASAAAKEAVLLPWRIDSQSDLGGGCFFKRSTEGRAVNCRKITNVTGPIVQTTKESQEDINDTPPRKSYSLLPKR